MQVDGACHCGSISFTAEIDQKQVMLCNRTDCQVLSGSPFRHVVPAKIETFVLSGQPTIDVKVAESGNPRVQDFCPKCGTPIYSSATESPAWVRIRIGWFGSARRSSHRPKFGVIQHILGYQNYIQFLAHRNSKPFQQNCRHHRNRRAARATPNASRKRSANGRPPGPATGDGVHCPGAGPGVQPSSAA